MSATLIDGKALAAQLRGRIGLAVAGLAHDHGLVPGLAVVLVGEDPASAVYVRNKAAQTAEAGSLWLRQTMVELFSGLNPQGAGRRSGR